MATGFLDSLMQGLGDIGSSISSGVSSVVSPLTDAVGITGGAAPAIGGGAAGAGLGGAVSGSSILPSGDLQTNFNNGLVTEAMMANPDNAALIGNIDMTGVTAGSLGTTPGQALDGSFGMTNAAGNTSVVNNTAAATMTPLEQSQMDYYNSQQGFGAKDLASTGLGYLNYKQAGDAQDANLELARAAEARAQKDADRSDAKEDAQGDLKFGSKK